MPGVMVYIDTASDPERLLAWARPIADAAGADLIALVCGGGAHPGLAAADVVLIVSHPALVPYLPEAHQAVLRAAIDSYSPEVVVFENTTAGYDLAASSAAAADLPLVGSCIEVSLTEGHAESASTIFGGQLLARVRTPLPAVFAVNSGSLGEHSAATGRGESAELAPPPELDTLRTSYVEAVEPPDEGVDLTKAERIVCIGRGIGGAENVELAEELATALGAEIAGSRPVIDSGWLPKVRQVGKSGARVAPKLYLALGVSGAPEHVEGMQGAELVIAVNSDPSAAIFQVADYGVAGDLFDVTDELISALG